MNKEGMLEFLKTVVNVRYTDSSKQELYIVCHGKDDAKYTLYKGTTFKVNNTVISYTTVERLRFFTIEELTLFMDLIQDPFPNIPLEELSKFTFY